MSRPIVYVADCASPGCANRLSRSQAAHCVRCPDCTKRHWNGQRVHTQAIWDARERILRFEAQKGAGGRWYLRCSLTDCPNEYRYVPRKEKRPFCAEHTWASQRIPYLRTFEHLRQACAADYSRRAPFLLSFERMQHILMSGKCIYCRAPHGAPLFSADKTMKRGAAGIDRVDPSRGYEDGNVVACCRDCNRKKHVYKCAADMFGGLGMPNDWPADSFYMSQGHRIMADAAREVARQNIHKSWIHKGHYGRGRPARAMDEEFLAP